MLEKIPALQRLVGNTNLVYLSHLSNVTGCNVFGKCEYENPGGSIKDRAALGMILGAEKRGLLTRGKPGIVVEGTAGNTGIGLALTSRVFGYKCVIVIANTNSQEKKNVLRWAGAHLVEVPAVPYSQQNNYVHVASRLAENLSKAGHNAFYANQWDNPDNRNAHHQTGKEILQQVQELTGKGVDAFSCAAGTGGTIAGVSEHMKQHSPDTQIFLTDPQGAKLKSYFETGTFESIGSSISEGIGQGRITGNLKDFKPDGCFEITDTEMMNALNDLQQHDGLALGTSAGINAAGTIKVAEKIGLGSGKNIVTVLCDVGQRYASKIYNDKFLSGKNLPIAPWLQSNKKEVPLIDSQIKDAIDKAIIP